MYKAMNGVALEKMKGKAALSVVSEASPDSLRKLMAHIIPSLQPPNGRSWVKLRVLVALVTLNSASPPLTHAWKNKSFLS